MEYINEFVSSFKRTVTQYVTHFRENASRGLKRRLEDLKNDSDDCEDWGADMLKPRRKKFMATSKYIYNALFLNGTKSDITIEALGNKWKLHKVYLCQSPYFSSMFSGSWKEANNEKIQIEIADPNITIEGMTEVFGSLYQDEITIDAAHVVPVLAAAMLFQLDHLIQHCCDIMNESMNIHTVIPYHETATQYGLEALHKDCFQWLLRNLLCYIPEHPNVLRDINLALMTKLVSSSDLFVIQTEFSLYIILKTWVFLQENELWNGTISECILESHKFFQSIADKTDKTPFLLSKRGKHYKSVFDALRLTHLINHHIDVEMLDMDQIIPPEWLSPMFKNQWYTMLRIDQGVERGPKQMSETEFYSSCYRCGRILPTDTQHIWRWTGYNFGLDLILIYDRRGLRMKRNDRSQSDPQNNSHLQSRRHVVYRFVATSVNEQKQVTWSLNTGIQYVTLNKNEEIKIMTFEKEATFPVMLSANFSLISCNTNSSATESEKAAS